MGKINSVFAVCLLVDNLKSSITFYQNVLGLVQNNQDKGFIDFKLEGTSFALFQKDSATTMFHSKYMGTGGGFVLAVQVENLKELAEDLNTKGITIIEGPKTTEWGQKVLYILDPDKNIIEISEK